MNEPNIIEQEKSPTPVASGDWLACVWSQDSDGSAWATGCGHLFDVNDGTPKENGMCFCAFCGRKLNESPYVDDIRDAHDDEYVAELMAKQANA